MSVVELFGVTDTLQNRTNENEKALALTAEAMKEAVAVFDSSDFKTNEGWKKETEDDQGSTVHSKSGPNGKLFVLRAEINAPAPVLFQDHWDGVELVHTWNTNIESAKRLVPLGDQSDVIYNAMNDILIVKGRDFVVGRMWRQFGDSYIVAGKSVDYNTLMPVQKGKVRATLHIGAGKFTPLTPTTTKLEYLLSMDFKGLIPKPVFNAVMGKLMLGDASMLKKHAETLVKA